MEASLESFGRAFLYFTFFSPFGPTIEKDSNSGSWNPIFPDFLFLIILL